MDFNQIYNTNYELIYKFSYRMLGSAAEADDITQESFVKLYNHLAAGKNIDTCRSWLYKVSSNLCKNRISRLIKFRTVLSDKYDHDERFADNSEEELARKEEAALLCRALDTMSLRDKTVLMLYQDNLSYEEIADVMNMKKGSVGKTLARALEKLSEMIKKES